MHRTGSSKISVIFGFGIIFLTTLLAVETRPSAVVDKINGEGPSSDAPPTVSNATQVTDEFRDDDFVAAFVKNQNEPTTETSQPLTKSRAIDTTPPTNATSAHPSRKTPKQMIPAFNPLNINAKASIKMANPLQVINPNSMTAMPNTEESATAATTTPEPTNNNTDTPEPATATTTEPEPAATPTSKPEPASASTTMNTTTASTTTTTTNKTTSSPTTFSTTALTTTTTTTASTTATKTTTTAPTTTAKSTTASTTTTTTAPTTTAKSTTASTTTTTTTAPTTTAKSTTASTTTTTTTAPTTTAKSTTASLTTKPTTPLTTTTKSTTASTTTKSTTATVKTPRHNSGYYLDPGAFVGGTVFGIIALYIMYFVYKKVQNHRSSGFQYGLVQ
ncbi:salivary glue protein Sgs-3-like [Mya arenaria]|uniref:salivary glue protein Sgs-3-like n=1 Tax=Mya arenaria TaxID=6604 RepID=UPI0022DEC117|nr:salivary glue protein Sgs-3-like [Mya arenaria]